MTPFSIRKLCLLTALLYVTKTGAQVLNVPGSDAKLTPSITGNSSLGNISNPNLFDGSTTVNVPIYSYETDAGNLGISMSFNTKGIKVDAIGTVIGVNWSLNAGGTISRVLKDLPDETWDTRYQTTGMPNEPRPYPMIGRMFWYNLTPAQIADQQVHHFYHDGESDDFIVSVGKLSFTFNIGKDGKVFSHPHNNARVQMLRNGSSVTMPTDQYISDAGYMDFSFVITDTDGNRYYFEKGAVQEKIYYDARFDLLEEIARWGYISQWVVSKIILANGAQITYNYVNALPGTAPVYQAFTAVEKTTAPQYDSRTANVSQSGSSKDLSSIVYPNGVTATFIYHGASIQDLRCDNPGIRMLDKIRVGTAAKAVQYRLNHVYALSQGTTNPGGELALGSPCQTMSPSSLPSVLGHRLRLKGIDILSDDGTQTEPYYSFGYNTSPMPRRLYGGQDYFGYANGLSLSETVFQQLVPYHPSPITGQYAGINKDANPEAIKAGNLVSVSNAYGGKSEFVYEGHQLSTVMTGLPGDSLYIGKGQADGLRLKSITETDRFYPGNAKVTSFTYSDGQIFLDGGYFHFPIRTSNNGATVDEYNMGGIYATAHQLINGSNHGYSQVTTEVKDQSGQLLGRSISRFSNFKDANGNLRTYIGGGGKNFYHYPYSDKQYIRDWEIGLPLYEAVYDQNGRIQSQKDNYFRFTLDLSASAYVYNTKKLETVPNTWQNNSTDSYYVYGSDNYSPYTGKALLDSSVSRKYISDNNFINDAVYYTYDIRNNTKTTITRTSEGQYTYLRNVYNYDLSGLGVPQPVPPGSTLAMMTEEGLEKVISQERWQKAGANSPYTDLLLDASVFGFGKTAGGCWVTNWMQNLESGSPVPYAEYTGGINGPGTGLNEYYKVRAAYDNGGMVAPARFRRTSEVQVRDGANNPTEVRLLGLEKYNAMIWDTTGNKLADVANARYSEIGYAGFENTTQGNWTYNTGLVQPSSAIPGGTISGGFALKTITNLPFAVSHLGLVAGKKYIITLWSKGGPPKVLGGGLSSINLEQMATKGDWKYYEGAFTPVNTSSIVLPGAVAGAGNSEYIDELRLFPADAMMTTATYEPFLGKTSASDANGRISYIEYDKLGRPMLVRDEAGNILSKTQYQVNP